MVVTLDVVCPSLHSLISSSSQIFYGTDFLYLLAFPVQRIPMIITQIKRNATSKRVPSFYIWLC